MRTVFFDIDTQIDFMYPAGSLYVPGAEEILPVIAMLNQKAPAVVSTMDAHTEDDPEFRIYPHHCVAGTDGQRKPAATLIGDASRQFFLPKRTLDCFETTELEPLLAQLGADAFVVYGVVTEICVRCAAFGLLQRGKSVAIVRDAVKALDKHQAIDMFDEFVAGGGRVISSGEALSLI